MKPITKKKIVAGLKNIHATISKANLQFGCRLEYWDTEGHSANGKIYNQLDRLNQIVEQLEEEGRSVENPKPQKAEIIIL